MGFQKLLELLRYYQPCRQTLAARRAHSSLQPSLQEPAVPRQCSHCSQISKLRLKRI